MYLYLGGEWVAARPYPGEDERAVKERALNEPYSLKMMAEFEKQGVFDDMRAMVDAPLAIGVWTHLAATYDGVTMRFYVNGVQVGSRAQTGSMLVSTRALRIGGNSVWGEYLNGLVDDVRIYNRALSPAEIQTDMNTAVGSGG